MTIVCCIRGYFILTNFASQTLRNVPLQFMSIYSNENIRKIVKLSPCKFLHLVRNRRKYLNAKIMAYTAEQILRLRLRL